MHDLGSRHQLVQRLRSQGQSIKSIAEIMEVHPSTVKRDLKVPLGLIRRRSRGAPVVTRRVKGVILRALRGRVNMSTRKVAEKLKDRGINVSHQTVWRVARVDGLKKKKNRRTFRLTAAQRKKRVIFARSRLGQPLTDLVFLDESPIEATAQPNPRNDGTWLAAEERGRDVQVDKHPMKINVISAISLRGTSGLYYYKENMNSGVFIKYLKKIVNDLRKGPFKDRQFTLVMDSATFHTSAMVIKWMTQRGIKFVPRSEWPSSSPDINPIENLWEPIQKRVQAREPRTMKGLKRVATRVWSELKMEEIAKFINVLPRRYQEIISEKGAQTRT
jgi:transposase